MSPSRLCINIKQSPYFTESIVETFYVPVTVFFHVVGALVDAGTTTNFTATLSEMESSIDVLCDATKMDGAHTCTHHTVSCICN